MTPRRAVASRVPNPDDIPVVAPPADPPRVERAPPRRKPKKPKPPSARGLLACTSAYGVLIWSMVFGVIVLTLYLAQRHGWDFDTVPPEAIRQSNVWFQTILTGFDAIVLLGVLWVAGRPQPQDAIVPPSVGWAGGFPVLVLVLILNVGLGVVVRYVFRVKPETDPTEMNLVTDGWLAVLMICVQPAIIEELFFRYFLLGHMRHLTNVHAAVFVSSGMFAAAHIGQIAGMPILFVVGMAFGYARVCSGSLLLPMIMHFLHNLAVISVPLWMK